MIYEARKFLQKSYEENDGWAKNIFINYLIKEKNYNIISSEEDFSHDIKTLNQNNEKVFFEVEVKNIPFTTKKSFPFETVSFLGRKEKFHMEHPFYYVIISNKTKCAVIAYSGDIYKGKYIEVENIDTKDRKGRDKFFRVPKEFCKFIDLNKNYE